MRKSTKWLFKVLPVLLAIFCAGLMIAFGRKFGLQEAQAWISDNRFKAILLVVALCAVKSLSVFFPLTALYCLTGLSLPLPAALGAFLAFARC